MKSFKLLKGFVRFLITLGSPLTWLLTSPRKARGTPLHPAAASSSAKAAAGTIGTLSVRATVAILVVTAGITYAVTVDSPMKRVLTLGASPITLYDTLSDSNTGYGSCSGILTDPRGGAPAGKFTQTFVVPAGTGVITDVTVPCSQWLSFQASIYRGGQRLASGTVPAGQDWAQYAVDLGRVAVTPGETLSLVLEDPTNPTGVGFWQARTNSDVYPQEGLTVDNPCLWAQGAHPAVDASLFDLVARIDGQTH